MNQRSLRLSTKERLDLESIRDHDARPYLRERAAALLKIADGMAPSVVAERGLLKRRHRETVFIWLNEYEVTRQVRPRPATRGAFSPSRPLTPKGGGAPSSQPARVGSDTQSLDAAPVEPPVPVSIPVE